MRYCSLLAMLACVSLSGCGQTSDPAAKNRTANKPPPVAFPATSVVQASGDYEIGEPLRVDNLTVFPVLSKTARDEDRFITLDEGLKAGTVEVFEVGAQSQAMHNNLLGNESADEPIPPLVEEINDVPLSSDEEFDFGNDEFSGADVNRLMVVNRSDKPLYLMPGEVIVGGSQDRTIAESVILAANSEPTEIDVYCVEHGRWGRRDSVESGQVIMALTSDSEQVESLAEDVSKGQFIGAGLLNKETRVAAADRKGQQEVWDEVAEANSKLNVNSVSGAFTFNFIDEDVQEKLAPYLSAMKNLSDTERVVGVIVAINGKPETVDVFESTPLFRKFWPKLMQGYCLDALQSADGEDADASCTRDAAAEFLASVVSGEGQESETSRDGLVLSRRETDDSVGFSAGGGMGGGAVHASGFSK